MTRLLLLIIFNLHFAKPIQLEFQLHSNFTKKAFWSLTKTLDFPYGKDCVCVCVCVCVSTHYESYEVTCEQWYTACSVRMCACR